MLSDISLSIGAGFANRNPCAKEHPDDLRNSSCSVVSVFSARVITPRRLQVSMMPRMTADCLSFRRRMASMSIFTRLKLSS